MWAKVALAGLCTLTLAVSPALGQATNIAITGHGSTWALNGQNPQSYVWPATFCTSSGNTFSNIAATTTSPSLLDFIIEADSHGVSEHAESHMAIDFDLNSPTNYVLQLFYGANGGHLLFDGVSQSFSFSSTNSFSGTLSGGHHSIASDLSMNGVASNNSFRTVLTLAPEPSSLGLLLLGGLALARRRRV